MSIRYQPRPLGLTAVLVLLAGPAPGGGHAPEPPGLHASGDGLLLVDPAYELAFTEDGLRLEPRRGPTWSWRLCSLGAGDGSWAASRGAPAAPLRWGTSGVRYRRGPVVEEYLIGPGRVEQRFVLAEPLPLGGRDLAIEGAVACRGTLRAGRSGWRWHDAGGFVSLGTVTVFDREGRVLPAAMEVTGDATRIVVDGAALARAAYPVTVDPEIGANDFRISEQGVDGDPAFAANDPAVAYNPDLDEYLVVWSGDDSALADDELEIYGQRIAAASGVLVGGRIRISAMGPDGDPAYDASRPAVAYNPLAGEYLVVWQGDDDAPPLVDDETEIFGRRISGAGLLLGADHVRISSMGTDGVGSGGGDAFAPAVACDTATGGYLVVWHGDQASPNNEFEIHGQRLDGAANELGGDFQISDVGPPGDNAFDGTEPALAYNATDGEYLVLWSGDDDTPPLVDGEFEIFGQRLDAATGLQLGTDDFRISDAGPDGDPAFGAFEPDVVHDPAGGRYLVVWSGDDDAGTLAEGEHEVFGQLLAAATGAELGANDFRISTTGIDGDPAADALQPAVGHGPAGHPFLVAWRADALADNEFEIHGQLLGAALQPVGLPGFRVSDAGPDGSSLFVPRAPVSYTHLTLPTIYSV